MKNLLIKALPPALRNWLRRTYLSRQVLEGQGKVERELEVLPTFVHEKDAVIDIGANVGVYTKTFSSLVGESGRIFAFEPLRDNLEILNKVIRGARLGNVRVFHAALGAEAGQQDMVIPDLGGFVGYYWAHLASDGETGKRETTDVLRLDDLYRSKDIDRVDFVKCDVEGGELDVLQGGCELLRAERPGLLFEVSQHTSGRVFELLTSLGYQPFVYGPRLERTETFRDGEFSNYFFFHPESKLWERAATLM